MSWNVLNSIIIPCKFRFIDEKIKLKINQWEFLNTANHTQKRQIISPAWCCQQREKVFRFSKAELFSWTHSQESEQEEREIEEKKKLEEKQKGFKQFTLSFALQTHCNCFRAQDCFFRTFWGGWWGCLVRCWQLSGDKIFICKDELVS